MNVISASANEIGVQLLFLEQLRRLENTPHSLPSLAHHVSLLDGTHSDHHDSPDQKHQFTMEIVRVDASKLLTPASNNWVDIVVNVKISITTATTTSAMICEIRIIHMRYVNSAAVIILRNILE